MNVKDLVISMLEQKLYENGGCGLINIEKNCSCQLGNLLPAKTCNCETVQSCMLNKSL